MSTQRELNNATMSNSWIPPRQSSNLRVTLEKSVYFSSGLFSGTFIFKQMPVRPIQTHRINTTYLTNAGLMIVQRLRRWPSIKPALVKCVMFTRIQSWLVYPANIKFWIWHRSLTTHQMGPVWQCGQLWSCDVIKMSRGTRLTQRAGWMVPQRWLSVWCSEPLLNQRYLK